MDEGVSSSEHDGMARLAEWLREGGLDVASSCTTPVHTDDSGWGMRTTRIVQDGQLMLSIPNKLIIRASLLAQCTPYRQLLVDNPTKLEPFDLLVLFIALERTIGDQSTFGPYIRVLPPYSPSIVADLAFPSDALPEKGRLCLLDQRRGMEAIYQRLRPMWQWLHAHHHLHISVDGTLDRSLYEWAWFCVNSRCVFTENTPHHLLDNVNNDTVALLPFFDLLNHAQRVKVVCRYMKNTQSFDVVAAGTFQEGDDVFICYGPHTSARLLIEYGFVADECPCNALPVTMDLLREIMPTGDPLVHWSATHDKVIEAADLRSSIYDAQIEPSWALLSVCKLLSLPSTALGPDTMSRQIYTCASFTEDMTVLRVCRALLTIILRHVEGGTQRARGMMVVYEGESKHPNKRYIVDCVAKIWEQQRQMVIQCQGQVDELIEEIELAKRRRTRTMELTASAMLRYFAGVFVLPLLTMASEFDFTVEVAAGKMSCYFQSVTEKKYHAMEVDYQVIDGGDLNINFLLLLSGKVLLQDRMKSDNSHRIDVKEQKGEFQLCFDNSFSYTERKVVFFEIFLYDEHNQLDQIDYSALAFGGSDGEGPISQQASQVTSVANRVKMALNKAEHYQALLRAWEARDRAIMEANLSRVQWWSIVNSIALMTAGFVQVYMIRSLFEENSKLGKLLRQ